VKRRYWIRGKDRARRNWLVWLALPVLAAAFVYGALIALPRVETDAALVPVSADRVPVSEPEPESEPEPLPAAETLAQTRPAMETEPRSGACAAAMTAALANARIEFLSSSVEIVPASRNVISVLAALAHACPGRIEIAGHSDNLGPESANQEISAARARSVAGAFIDFGLEPQRLSVRGFGSSQPVADNATREGRARNRRIEMTLLDDPSAGSGE
jgi:OOP family OmpA-OmpF porin